jgi:hypothetical protein
MLTEQQRAEIHAALEQTNGDRAAAARLLGMDTKQLAQHIHNTRDLRACWSQKKPEPPTECEIIHREASTGLLPVTGGNLFTEAEALQKEDDALKKGLSALGIGGNLVELAHSLQQFQSKHFTRVIELMGGGLTRRFLKIEEAIDDIDQALRLLDPTCPEDVAREQILRQDRAALIDLQQKCYDRVNKAALTQAIIKEKQKAGHAPDRGKPGFSPKQIVAQPGSHVTVK